jgi:hypothetical protein
MYGKRALRRGQHVDRRQALTWEVPAPRFAHWCRAKTLCKERVAGALSVCERSLWGMVVAGSAGGLGGLVGIGKAQANMVLEGGADGGGGVSWRALIGSAW